VRKILLLIYILVISFNSSSKKKLSCLEYPDKLCYINFIKNFEWIDIKPSKYDTTKNFPHTTFPLLNKAVKSVIIQHGPIINTRENPPSYVVGAIVPFIATIDPMKNSVTISLLTFDASSPVQDTLYDIDRKYREYVLEQIATQLYSSVKWEKIFRKK
jgi:hypothetical protein